MRWAAVAVVTLTLVSTATATGLQDEPDSLRSVLELSISRTSRVEISGASITEFRLYTQAKLSRLAWWHEGTLYRYTLDGPSHEQRAAALLSTLSSGSLVTFVANRHPKKRHGTVPVADVEAIQIAASLGVNLR